MQATSPSSGAWNPTQRHRQVIDGLERGLTNKEIAGELGLKLPTVKTHLLLLFARIGARSRSHAVVIFRERY